MKLMLWKKLCICKLSVFHIYVFLWIGHLVYRNLDQQLFNKANEIQEEICRKRWAAAERASARSAAVPWAEAASARSAAAPWAAGASWAAAVWSGTTEAKFITGFEPRVHQFLEKNVEYLLAQLHFCKYGYDLAMACSACSLRAHVQLFWQLVKLFN